VISFDPVEARVIGALVEKQMTTPQQYPLTLNALVAACNQTSSRNPVVSYDDHTVESALARLKERRLLRFVFPSHGRSVTRYRQVLEEVLPIEPRQLALLAVLLLRGPQTLGELRSRTERMAEFASLDEVDDELDDLASRDEPLVARLPREPGRKEMRYAQLLAGDTGAVAGAPPETYVAPAAPSPPVEGVHHDGGHGSLASQVAVLRAEVAALRRELDEVIARLGGR
jgi:uncharacterized protein YceH (UPF0502 family)